MSTFFQSAHMRRIHLNFCNDSFKQKQEDNWPHNKRRIFAYQDWAVPGIWIALSLLFFSPHILFISYFSMKILTLFEHALTRFLPGLTSCSAICGYSITSADINHLVSAFEIRDVSDYWTPGPPELINDCISCSQLIRLSIINECISLQYSYQLHRVDHHRFRITCRWMAQLRSLVIKRSRHPVITVLWW